MQCKALRLCPCLRQVLLWFHTNNDNVKILLNETESAVFLVRSLVKTKVTRELQNEITDNQKVIVIFLIAATFLSLVKMRYNIILILILWNEKFVK